MENYSVILGVDVSKLTLDISWAEGQLHVQISNDKKGFINFKRWCKLHGIGLKSTFIVLEHTGGYEYQFIQFCATNEIAYCRIPGLELKNH